MPAPSNTLLIEGSFEELCDELATYIDSLNTAQGQQQSSLQSEVAPLLQEGKQEDALKKVVTASSVLNSAPERELLAAYNLLIHLVTLHGNTETFLPPICRNLASPITSSPFNSVGLALNALSTVFNTLPPTDESRYHVLLAILKIVRNSTATFEQLRPQLQNLQSWLESWEMDGEDQRKLYLAIADVANDSAEEEQGYQYLLTALRTLQGAEEASSAEARELSLRALKSALQFPTHFDFQDLTSLDSIQALRKSDPVAFELLEIFNADQLDDFRDFCEANSDFLSSQKLDDDVLERKMRLLTLASLAAGAGQTRTLPYSTIAKALQIPSEDVEMWAIDGIRSGLVEGRLSQSDKSFLVHRATYRVFGEHQWREVASRLDMWRSSLQGVLHVIRQEKANYIKDKENELRDADQREKGMGYKPARVARNAPVEVGLD
ncbi:hypothetical protein AAFC00_003775 [Neodothiora populina]|uniref:Eukaryotic translation initiation factor 3 subunit M n=1 Tax=Neodothiora populina TaxID=2781224 RepID=A0ABR3PFK1_9PEZI